MSIMMKNINLNFCDFPQCQCHNGVNPNDAVMDEAIYGSDEFRMFAYKIKRCTRTRSHDWTECPYAHRGEKAQRRDPRKVPYCAVACPAFRNGRCLKGDVCEFAHGIFEYWLHPMRYRTRACNARMFCQRRVCFFAHTPEQLRSEARYRCPLHHLKYKVAVAVQEAEPAEVPALPAAYSVTPSNGCFEGVSEFLMSLRKMKIKEEEAATEEHGGSDMPHAEWITELVN